MNEVGKVVIKLSLAGQKEAVADAKQAGTSISTAISDALTSKGGVASIMQETTSAIYKGAKTAITQVSKVALGTAATALTNPAA